jgi:DNA-binding beta-propeller fold protein YncE
MNKFWSKFALLSGLLFVQNLDAQEVKLFNGWPSLEMGDQLSLADLPIHAMAHPSLPIVYIQHSGQSGAHLYAVDVLTMQRIDSIRLPDSFYGGAITANRLWITAGNANYILEFSIAVDGSLRASDTLRLGQPWPHRVSPTGMVFDPKSSNLVIGTREDSALYVWDLKKHQVSKRIPMSHLIYGAAADVKRGKAYFSLWSAGQVVEFDLKKLVVTNRFDVGDNPNELLLDAENQRLFVACADDNSVHAIDLSGKGLNERLITSISPDAPTGSTPNSLALSKSGHLWVANADNNNLAVFDVRNIGHSVSAGFIPTGWYPTQVRVVAQHILVANGKGLASSANPNGPNSVKRKTQVVYQEGQEGNSPIKVEYIGALFKGSLSRLKLEDVLSNLPNYTAQVLASNPYEQRASKAVPEGHLLSLPREDQPIRHVFYIIKENRTYDQVLSDMPAGDGDTSLLLFGETYTPNQHKIAREFALFDRFFVEAEVSADGHNWSTAAMANDYTEKTWPISYGGRGSEYVYEGQYSVAHPKDGFIWDHAKRAGLTYRTYGQFADDYKANYPTLENHFCTYYTSWDEGVMDTIRFHQWKRDFDSLVAINEVPELNTLRFINDHTEGLSVGRPTPYAHVADNDLAVGMFLDHLSHSPIWSSSAVFVIEDDAQDGPDHVDAHRSIAFVASPYVRRASVDHTPYTTSSMLRTIGLILGMPPMSQYDASATPMWAIFQNTPDLSPYVFEPARTDLSARNAYRKRLSEASASLDFSKEDKIDEALMNYLLWVFVHGEEKPMPAPVRSAFSPVK